MVKIPILVSSCISSLTRGSGRTEERVLVVVVCLDSRPVIEIRATRQGKERMPVRSAAGRLMLDGRKQATGLGGTKVCNELFVDNRQSRTVGRRREASLDA